MDGIRSVLKNINKYSCPYKINLHCHTICSDGSLTPIQLFHQAYKIGIQHLAITDHHTIDGYKSILASKEFQELSIEYPTIWSGVEISGLLKGCLVHIIALDFNTTSLDIQKYLQTYSLKGEYLRAESIINAIHEARGVAILAHPARYKLNYKDLIIEAKKLGFDGIEVWYNYERSTIWSPSTFICDKISKLTDDLGMLSTCGTDTHGISILSR